MNARDSILASIPEPMFDVSLQPSFSSDCIRDKDELWELFFERFSALGGEAISADALQNYTRSKVFVEPGLQAKFEAVIQHNCDDLWEADVSVVQAHCACADTGVLVFAAGAGKSRLASVVPPIVVTVIAKSAISFDLNSALTGERERTCVLVAGPSRTADIEGELVRGIHGPSELRLKVCDED